MRENELDKHLPWREYEPGRCVCVYFFHFSCMLRIFYEIFLYFRVDKFCFSASTMADDEDRTWSGGNGRLGVRGREGRRQQLAVGGLLPRANPFLPHFIHPSFSPEIPFFHASFITIHTLLYP